jgi:hypothetical protein
VNDPYMRVIIVKLDCVFPVRCNERFQHICFPDHWPASKMLLVNWTLVAWCGILFVTGSSVRITSATLPVEDSDLSVRENYLDPDFGYNYHIPMGGRPETRRHKSRQHWGQRIDELDWHIHIVTSMFNNFMECIYMYHIPYLWMYCIFCLTFIVIHAPILKLVPSQ